MHRQVVIDTETTGLSPDHGHRIIEIGAWEIVNRRVTGKKWHTYLQPDLKISEGAMRVHGISDDFLLDKPRFNEIAQDLLGFLQDAELIIHNAPFDMGFFDHEFKLINQKPLSHICSVFDTLDFARKKHPGQKNNLDALCKRYNIDNSQRQLHGALLDAEILAELYLVMTSGQENLSLAIHHSNQTLQKQNVQTNDKEIPRDLIIMNATIEEESAHQEFLQQMQKNSGKIPVWLQD